MKSLESRHTAWFLPLALLACWTGIPDARIMARTGGGGGVTLSPSSIPFGNVPVGSSVTVNETVTNVGSRNIYATGAIVRGNGFSISGLNFPLTLNAGESITFTVSFAPAASGAVIGNVSLHSYNANVNLPLSGTGTAPGQLSVAPVSMNFGKVNVGSSGSQSATITASGSSVVVTAATIDNPEFAASGLSFPITLNPGQSQSFTVTFTPTASGTATASLQFIDNPNAPTVESLSGTGVSNPPPAVSLSWNADGSGAVGYNVFRGSASGGPYSQINSITDTNTDYTDTGVSSGQTYYYVTTAVNGEGQQSGFSNQVQAVIP